MLIQLGDHALATCLDAGPDVALDGGAAGERLGAAAFAAPAYRTIGQQDHVPNLGAGFAPPLPQLAAQHQPAAQPRAHEDADHILRADARAEGALAVGAQVHVILDEDR